MAGMYNDYEHHQHRATQAHSRRWLDNLGLWIRRGFRIYYKILKRGENLIKFVSDDSVSVRLKRHTCRYITELCGTNFLRHDWDFPKKKKKKE
jgi:hypothetical protein